jgi:predicted cation transporter
LAAIEIVPEMSVVTLKYLIVSLIISGGMMIPGNIPNIICASKLKITSKEWIKVGFPLGMIMLVFYFLFIRFIN